MAFGIAFLGTGILACGSSTGESSEKTGTVKPTAAVLSSFNADSAYAHIARQVSFGPRVPGSAGHRLCRQYIISALENYGADSIIVQDTSVTAFNGDRLPISNIFARFGTETRRHILLVAHWDTRPWGDNEHDRTLRSKPIPGANDGGSGVGVLLEIARNLQIKRPEIGVDLLFVDAEDYGTNEGFGSNPESWCLGTQHWVTDMPYTSGNMPKYGILLDMVGGRNARFHYEAGSKKYAPAILQKVWNEAHALGFGSKFIQKPSGVIIDDHVYLSEAGIPTIDIIESLNEETASFNPTWHTHDDNLENIDRKSLDAVGKTVMNVVYKEIDK